MKRENVKGYPKVKGFLVERGIRQREVADILGVTLSTLNNKLNGIGDFTVSEVKKICIELDMKAEIFFTDFVPIKQQGDEMLCTQY